MADYATLKAAIEAVIYENGNQEITGSVMQATLLTMVNSLGANYQYAGIATPSTNPGTPDQNVFYLASTAGTYVNFGNIVLAENEVAILKYNGGWTKETSGFASAEKVNQLEQELNGEADYDANLTASITQGSTYPSTKRTLADKLEAGKVYHIRVTGTAVRKITFYTFNENNNAVSCKWAYIGSASSTSTSKTLSTPWQEMTIEPLADVYKYACFVSAGDTLETGDIVINIHGSGADGLVDVVESLVEDVESIKEEVADLESLKDLEDFFGTTKNFFNPEDPDFETGKWISAAGGKNTMSTAAISPFIPLTQEIGTLVASVNGVQMNYGGYGICLYNSNKNFVTGWTEGNKGYAEWQAGVAYARFTLLNYANGNIQIEQGTTPTSYVPYKFGIKGDDLLPGSVNASAIAPGAISSDKIAPDASFPAMLPAISLCGLKGESVEEASLSDETITIVDWPIYLKSSAIVSMEAQITSFGTIYVGVGPAYTRSRFVKIDATNVYFGHGNSTPDAIDKTVAHGLSIGTFIKVIVAIEGLKTTAIVSTIDGVFKDECTRSDVSGNHESYGPPFLKADSLTALTDVKLNANSTQFQCPVWVFGDSMASEFDTRWPYYARYVWGFDFYLDALAGGKSFDLFPDLELALAHGTPKYLLWMLGVNDLLNGQSISYKTYVEQVEALCASHGIELILQRFPSFPEVDPTSINEWIDARGHRVVDFYRATGSDNAGNWYPGYMDNDNRHPTALGAKAEASQVCIDVPEIMQ